MQIGNIWMQFLTTLKALKAFECKFESDSKDSNPIRTIQKGFEALILNVNSNHSKGIRSIRMQSYHSTGIQSNRIPILSIRIQILIIQKGFEAFKSNSDHSKGIHSNENLNHSNKIRNTRMQILTIRTKFEPFKRG